MESKAKPALPMVDVPEEEPAEGHEADPLTNHAASQLRKILGEIAKRRIEALNLYEPLPTQYQFHKCNASERLIRGSNRSGKTLAAAVEVARAVCGCDPFDKYPKRDGRCYIVGNKEEHLARTMWQTLGKAGAFKIIRDKKTGLWRAFRPWTKDDQKRRFEAKPAPPLIPPRLIKTIAWSDKRKGVPALVQLHTGWEISCYSANADPTKGTQIDIGWFDEEENNPEWYPEIAARLIDRSGKFIWSATPEAGTQALYDLHETALRQHECERPRVVEFVALLDDNPHLTKEQKQEFSDKIVDEDLRRVKIHGEFAISSYKVYPEYSQALHWVDWFQIPDDWSRYMIVDPGRQVCACLFAAVPPPEKGDHVYLYDELYIRDCDAVKFGRLVAEKVGSDVFQAFLIDMHMGRQTEMGSGRTVEDQYTEALVQNNIKSLRTGNGFAWGSDDVDAGILKFRQWLVPSRNGGPRLRVLRDKLPNFDWEIKRFHYKRQSGLVTDKPEARQNHLMDTARYLAMYEPKWVKPQKSKKPEGYVLKILRVKEEKRRLKEGPRMIRLGPGVA